MKLTGYAQMQMNLKLEMLYTVFNWLFVVCYAL